jgi:hypothetical protein
VVGLKSFCDAFITRTFEEPWIFNPRTRSAEVTVVILWVGVSFHLMVRGCDAVPVLAMQVYVSGLDALCGTYVDS